MELTDLLRSYAPRTEFVADVFFLIRWLFWSFSSCLLGYVLKWGLVFCEATLFDLL